MADTPFGLSFGNPSKYMGQSPLADIGKAAKTGLMIYGLQQSGVIDALNKMGIKQNKQGGFNVDVPAGAAVPTPQAMVPAAPAPVVPPASQPQAAPVAPGVVVQPVPETNAFPPDIGDKILNDEWHGVEVDVSNNTDFNPLPPAVSNQVALDPNAYQQIPGYGKIAKAFQTFAGMG